ncbi:MAG: hypothetical protein IPJ78_13430 [Gemmatimonadetes bacterium]|nr:hypothetical protein [Gemmatimonadota bacterium]
MTWKMDETPERRPKFGRRALAWFRSAVRYGVRSANAPRGVDPDDFRERLVDWFASDHFAYVGWVPHDEYRGMGYPTGAWRLDQPAILRDLPNAVQAVQDECARLMLARLSSLEDWLAADLSGTLPAAPGGGATALPSAVRDGLRVAAHGRRERSPRLCPDCGRTWRPRTRIVAGSAWRVFVGNDRLAKRCPECRDAERPASAEPEAKPCADCGAEWSPKDGREARSPRCSRCRSAFRARKCAAPSGDASGRSAVAHPAAGTRGRPDKT